MLFSGLTRVIFIILYQFSAVAVKNYHALNSLKQHGFIMSSLGVQESEMGFTGLISRCQQVCAPCRGSREESVSLAFPASKGCSFPWLMSSLHLQSQQWLVKFFSCDITLIRALLPSSSSIFKDLVITLGPLRKFRIIFLF